MADKHFDAVFIRTSLTSLAAAALLAKEGRSILLLEPFGGLEQDGPHRPFHGFLGPLLYFGYEGGGAVEGYFRALSFPIPNLQKNGLRYEKVSPQLQIVLPSHRINLYLNEAAYLDELKREYGKQAEKLKILFDQVERDSAGFYPFLGQYHPLEIFGMGDRLGEWKKQLDFSQVVRAQQRIVASDLLSQYNFTGDLRDYFSLLTRFAFRKSLSEVSAFDFLRLFSSLKKGGVRIRGGYPVLATFFHHLIEARGGSIKAGKNVIRTEKQGKELVKIFLSDGQSVSATRFIVSQPSPHSRLDFFFTIPHRLIPIPMKEYLLMTWGGRRPPVIHDLLVLQLEPPQLEPPVENRDSYPKTRKLTVSIFLKRTREISKRDYQLLESQVVERLNWLIPFSQSEIHPVGPPGIQDLRAEGTENNVFPSSEGKSEKRLRQREILRGAASYFQAADLKNVYILKSDQSDTISWGSSFIAGIHLAKRIDPTSRPS